MDVTALSQQVARISLDVLFAFAVFWFITHGAGTNPPNGA